MSFKIGSETDRLITEKMAADYLGLSPRTLRNWRVLGRGPKFIRVSARCIRYRVCDLQAWAAERMCQSTSVENKAA